MNIKINGNFILLCQFHFSQFLVKFFFSILHYLVYELFLNKNLCFNATICLHTHTWYNPCHPYEWCVSTPYTYEMWLNINATIFASTSFYFLNYALCKCPTKNIDKFALERVLRCLPLFTPSATQNFCSFIHILP